VTVEKSVNAFQGSSLLAAIKSILLESTWIAARWIKAAYANAEAAGGSRRWVSPAAHRSQRFALGILDQIHPPPLMANFVGIVVAGRPLLASERPTGKSGVG